MAKKNRPARPGAAPAPAPAPTTGGGGGNSNNNRNRNRNNNRNRNRGGGGGGGSGLAGGTTEPGFDYSGITADPGAWMEGQMSAAGFDPTRAGPYSQFLNDQVITPFVGGWDTYQTENPTGNVGMGDYIAGLGIGSPMNANTVGGQNAPLGPDTSRLWDHVMAVIARYSPQARGIYDSGKDRGGTRWSVYS